MINNNSAAIAKPRDQIDLTVRRFSEQKEFEEGIRAEADVSSEDDNEDDPDGSDSTSSDGYPQYSEEDIGSAYPPSDVRHWHNRIPVGKGERGNFYYWKRILDSFDELRTGPSEPNRSISKWTPPSQEGEHRVALAIHQEVPMDFSLVNTMTVVGVFHAFLLQYNFFLKEEGPDGDLAVYSYVPLKRIVNAILELPREMYPQTFCRLPSLEDLPKELKAHFPFQKTITPMTYSMSRLPQRWADDTAVTTEPKLSIEGIPCYTSSTAPRRSNNHFKRGPLASGGSSATRGSLASGGSSATFGSSATYGSLASRGSLALRPSSSALVQNAPVIPDCADFTWGDASYSKVIHYLRDCQNKDMPPAIDAWKEPLQILMDRLWSTSRQGSNTSRHG